MDDKSNQLADITSLSEAMLSYAQAGDWDNVFLTEEKRGSVLNQLFCFPLSNEEKQRYSEQIRKIILLNKELEELTATARENVRDNLKAVNKGSRAVGAYSAHKSL